MSLQPSGGGRFEVSVNDTPVVEKSHENRTWVDKMYFRPFSRDEINRNSKLVQNPGYDK